MPNEKGERVQTFMSVTGDEVTVISRPCGCFHEVTYDPISREELLIRVQICSECWGEAWALLDQGRTPEQYSLLGGLP